MAFTATNTDTNHNTPTEADPRPGVAIGHIGPHPAIDIAAAVRFFEQLGTRTVAVMPAMAILELRGGTHLIVRKVDRVESGTTAAFDLMVDDIDVAHDDLADTGLQPGPVERGGIHSSFGLVDPSGVTITVTSSHAMGPV